MNYKTLENTSIEILTEVFNLAFKDYFVEVNLTPQQLESKFSSENVKLELSVGAFDGGQLIGFIFHAADTINSDICVYNAGTGVVPAFRGKQITAKMYDFILPKLKQKGVNKSLLEVITMNTKALKIYESIGFTTKRVVDCFKGEFYSDKEDYLPYFFIEDGFNYEKEMEEFISYNPTWQNSNYTINRLKDSVKTLTIRKSGMLLGCLVLNSNTGKVLQFAVNKSHRKKGIGTYLFKKASELKGSLMVYNLDNSDTEASELLKKGGLTYLLSQYEMELIIMIK